MKDTLGSGPTQYFYNLTPELIMDSVEELGLYPTGRCLALNSMENRVFEIEIEDDQGQRSFLVGKYYRPGRWNREQIQEEHDFLLDLKRDEIPTIAPVQRDGETLFELTTEDQTPLFYALFPKAGGRHFEADVPGSLERLGSMLARLHQTGRAREYENRPRLDGDHYARRVAAQLLAGPYLPKHLASSYQEIVEEIADLADTLLEPLPYQRVHGDCHHGNVLIHDTLAFVDFDDTMMAPIMQDFWMALSGDEAEFYAKRDRLAEGYEVFAPFPYEQESVIEVLRSLRMIHYNGWIAKRYDDPSFKLHFPYFEEESFWSSHLYDLIHQRDLIKSAASTRSFHRD